MDKKEICYILLRIQYSKNRSKSQNIILSKSSQSKQAQAKPLHVVKVGTVVNLGASGGSRVMRRGYVYFMWMVFQYV